MNADDDDIDPVREAVSRGVDAFEGRAFVRFPPDLVTQLTGFVDAPTRRRLLASPAELAEVEGNTFGFLMRMVELIAPDAVNPPHILFHRTGEPLRIRPEAVRNARQRLWCTIYPFCSPED